MAGNQIGFDVDNVRPSTKCNCWSELGPVPKFGLDQFRRYCDFYFSAFCFEIAYLRPHLGEGSENIYPKWRHPSS